MNSSLTASLTEQNIVDCFSSRQSFPTTTFVSCTLFFFVIGMLLGYALFRSTNSKCHTKKNNKHHAN